MNVGDKVVELVISARGFQGGFPSNTTSNNSNWLVTHSIKKYQKA